MSDYIETVGIAKHKGKNYSIFLEYEDGRPTGFTLELPDRKANRKRLSGIMAWADRNSAKIDYTSLRPDIGEIEARIISGDRKDI